MKKLNNGFISFFVGLIFAMGLGVSGMTQPEKVIGFLDFFGTWDPSLAFVMIGAIGFHGICYPLIMKRSSPILSEQFQVPTKKELNPRLILGAALFGAGWALAGYCPGPAITSLGTGSSTIVIFVVSMLVGMVIFRILKPTIDKILN